MKLVSQYVSAADDSCLYHLSKDVQVVPLTNTHTHTHNSPEGISLADSHPHSWRLSHWVCTVTDHRAGETLWPTPPHTHTHTHTHTPASARSLGHSTPYTHVHTQHTGKIKWKQITYISWKKSLNSSHMPHLSLRQCYFHAWAYCKPSKHSSRTVKVKLASWHSALGPWSMTNSTISTPFSIKHQTLSFSVSENGAYTNHSLEWQQKMPVSCSVGREHRALQKSWYDCQPSQTLLSTPTSQ